MIEYIKSSVDIILNLKFEEIEKRLMDKNGNSNRGGGGMNETIISSNKNNNNDNGGDTQ